MLVIHPVVSVCIPIYNCDDFIEKTIQSVLNQSFSDFELILINDNSTDETEETILRLNDPRIRYYKNTSNLGMVKNWNMAVKYASGKYIKLLCQDDLLSSDCLEKQVQVLENFNNVVLVSCSVNIISENDKILMTRRNFRNSCMKNGIKIGKKSLIVGKNLFGEPSAIMLRKRCFEQVGFYDKQFWYVPDWDFSLRCLSIGDFYYINDVLTSFRVSKKSQTTKIIKNNENELYNEDKRFLKKYEKSEYYSLNRFELFYHNFRTHFRTFLKKIFLLFFV